MRAPSLALLVLVLLAPRGAAAGKRQFNGIIVLDGQRMGVRWSDGDSFKFTAGPHKRRGTRLMGFNTLESYGPVHRWGDWTPEELYALAKSSAKIAVSREWACRWGGEKDGYGRMLVDCPELTKEMVRQGHAMAFAVEGKADPELLELQREAQANKRGMWAKGVPALLLSSVHSADVEGGGYNRAVDTRTGAARKLVHKENYEVCQEVCVGKGAASSCLVFVPFEARYRNKPPCLTGRTPRP